MIRISKKPKTFTFGFYHQDFDRMQFDYLFTDNLYQLEKIIQSQQYPYEWLDECIKLVIGGVDFEKQLTIALCSMLKIRNQTTIAYMNFISWPMKLVYDYDNILNDTLKLDLEVLKQFELYNQNDFKLVVELKLIDIKNDNKHENRTNV